MSFSTPLPHFGACWQECWLFQYTVYTVYPTSQLVVEIKKIYIYGMSFVVNGNTTTMMIIIMTILIIMCPLNPIWPSFCQYIKADYTTKIKNPDWHLR